MHENLTNKLIFRSWDDVINPHEVKFWLSPNAEINKTIIDAANRNHKDIDSKDIKAFSFRGLPEFLIYKINGSEYFIEKDDSELAIGNYKFVKKRLKRIGQLSMNRDAASKMEITINKELLIRADKQNLQNIDTLNESIDGLFKAIQGYHLPTTFSPEYKGEFPRMNLLKLVEDEGGWFEIIEENYRTHWNNLFMCLNDYFNNLAPNEFYNIRNFVRSEIANIIMEITDMGFYLGYSPFQKDVNSIGKRFDRSYSDEKIMLKKELGEQELNTQRTIRSKKKNKAKVLEDYFYCLNDKEKFLQDLKTTFQTEKGIPFGILLEELKKIEVLKIGNSEFENFLRCAKSFFDQDIGSRVGITNFKKKKVENYKEEIDIIFSKLKPLIDQHKSH